ncbi:hypothetical protein K525DRAFT_198302 [Schizophyllum commune Loenen D]|nr:hypothetical protein K525DRAFT_198302 [Schizophyllum commune Loenen D]
MTFCAFFRDRAQLHPPQCIGRDGRQRSTTPGHPVLPPSIPLHRDACPVPSTARSSTHRTGEFAVLGSARDTLSDIPGPYGFKWEGGAPWGRCPGACRRVGAGWRATGHACDRSRQSLPDHHPAPSPPAAAQLRCPAYPSSTLSDPSSLSDTPAVGNHGPRVCSNRAPCGTLSPHPLPSLDARPDQGTPSSLLPSSSSFA